MKKFTLLLFAISLFAGAVAAQKSIGKFRNESVASTQNPINVIAPITGAELNSDFIMPISVADTTGRGIIAYQFDLHFDPTVIQPQGTPVEVSGTLSSGLAAVYNPFNPGLLKVAVYGAYPLTGSGTLIKLRFKAVGAVGSVTQVRWSNFMFNEGNPASSPTDGQIRITANSTPGGISLSGRENMPGTPDVLNHMVRGNTLSVTPQSPSWPASRAPRRLPGGFSGRASGRRVETGGRR